MDPDLMHAASEWSAEHDTALPVVAHPLELCAALLSVGRHLAHTNLVAHNLYWLATLRLTPSNDNINNNTFLCNKVFISFSYLL
jgi:hypothetical protein